MFTGLIEQQGMVLSNSLREDAHRLLIGVDAAWDGLQTGDSIAVNGVCLTVLSIGSNANELAFDVSPETRRVTSLGALKQKDAVNLERAMLASTRFGGHYVSGHVDATAQLLSVTPMGDCFEMVIGGFLPEHALYLLPKGSITIDGVSLTINAVDPDRIAVMLIPHTLEKTTLGKLSIGACLNVEFDYLTRIVAHQLGILRA